MVLAPESLLRHQPAPTRGKASGCWLAEMDGSAVMCLQLTVSILEHRAFCLAPFSLINAKSTLPFPTLDALIHKKEET